MSELKKCPFCGGDASLIQNIRSMTVTMMQLQIAGKLNVVRAMLKQGHLMI